MKRMYLNDILSVIGLKLLKNDVIIRSVKNDIRKLGDNTLVFHLNKAEEINIHDFRRYRDCYIVTDQPILKDFIKKEYYIFVENISEAYKKFIEYYRCLFDVRVVAVTGTCGKTTTKEMITQVLKNEYKVVSTISSKNNIKYNHGYLMRFNDETRFGVFETAITHPGHLIMECEIFKPEIGIITNIGIDHLNWCKTLNNYIRTKAEMLVGLKNKGYLIINNDDEFIKKIDFSNYEGKVITFGINKNSDYFGRDIIQGLDKTSFTLVTKEREYHVMIPICGTHNVYNALAACACLDTLGMNLKTAINYLSNYVPIRSHTEIKKGLNNSIIIDDTWSSNPTSMKAALDVLTSFGQKKKKILIMGKISYLGKYKKGHYKKIASEIIEKNIDGLITIDEDSKKIGDYAASMGMSLNNIYNLKTKTDIKNLLKQLLDENTVALFKTSMIDKNSQEILRDVIN